MDFFLFLFVVALSLFILFPLLRKCIERVGVWFAYYNMKRKYAYKRDKQTQMHLHLQQYHSNMNKLLKLEQQVSAMMPVSTASLPTIPKSGILQVPTGDSINLIQGPGMTLEVHQGVLEALQQISNMKWQAELLMMPGQTVEELIEEEYGLPWTL